MTGNVHSRVSRGTPWDESYEPMGMLVADTLEGRLPLALNLSSTDGTAWTCNSGRAEDCGARKMGGRGEGEDWSALVVHRTTPGEKGHHGHYHVGAITASPPAVGERGMIKAP